MKSSLRPQGASADSPSFLLTVRDAAIALAISERKLWTLTKSGEMPVVRLGRSVRYRPEDLREFARQRANQEQGA